MINKKNFLKGQQKNLRSDKIVEPKLLQNQQIALREGFILESPREKNKNMNLRKKKEELRRNQKLIKDLEKKDKKRNMNKELALKKANEFRLGKTSDSNKLLNDFNSPLRNVGISDNRNFFRLYNNKKRRSKGRFR